MPLDDAARIDRLRDDPHDLPMGERMERFVRALQGRICSALERIEAAAEVRIAFITRFGEGQLPGPDTSYQQGDVVHAMLRTQEVDEVAKVFAKPPQEPEEQEYREDDRPRRALRRGPLRE